MYSFGFVHRLLPGFRDSIQHVLRYSFKDSSRDTLEISFRHSFVSFSHNSFRGSFRHSFSHSSRESFRYSIWTSWKAGDFFQDFYGLFRILLQGLSQDYSWVSTRDSFRHSFWDSFWISSRDSLFFFSYCKDFFGNLSRRYDNVLERFKIHLGIPSNISSEFYLCLLPGFV